MIACEYSCAAWAAELVRSVLAQSFADLELFFLDDGSAPGTREALAPSAGDARLRYERQEPPGRTAAHELFNRALAQTGGELIAIAHGDDAFEPGKLARQVALLDADPALDACFHDARLADRAGREMPGSLAPPLDPALLRSGRLAPALLAANWIPESTVVLRRSLLRRIGLHESGPLHHYQFWLRAALAGARFALLPDRLIRYRVREPRRGERALELREQTRRMRRELLERTAIEDWFPELALCSDPRRARALAHLELGLRLAGAEPDPERELADAQLRAAAALDPALAARPELASSAGEELHRLRAGPPLERPEGPAAARVLAAFAAASDAVAARALLRESLARGPYADGRALVVLTEDDASTRRFAGLFGEVARELGVEPARTARVDLQQLRPAEFEAIARAHSLWRPRVAALGGPRDALLAELAQLALAVPQGSAAAAAASVPISFCIITGGGREPLLDAVVRSIRAQKIAGAEIVIAGDPPDWPGIVRVEALEAARAGRLGELRNRAVQASRGERVAVLDDDIVLAPDWYAFLCAAGEFDILTSQLRLPDGSRYWDHATCGTARGHVMLDAHERDGHLYMTGGGAWVMARRVACALGWDAERAFYENEDVEFAARCRAHGFRIQHAPACWAVHLDGRYTQIGRRVHRRTRAADARWVLQELRGASLSRVLQCAQEHLQAQRAAEAADAIRFGLACTSGADAVLKVWKIFEESNGGALQGSRFHAEGDPAVRELLRGLGLELGPLLDFRSERGAAAPARVQVGAPALGVNLIGYLSGNLGLGVAARAYLRLLRERGVEVCPVEVEVSGGRAGHDPQYSEQARCIREPTPHAVNLFVLNPGDIIAVIRDGHPSLARRDRLTACIPFWELARLPEPWVQPLEAMDLVLAPSRFVEHSCQARLSGVRIRYLPTPVYVDACAGPDRRRFGLAEGELVFVSCFEMASDPNRKNPWGAIEAFQRAFAPGDPARLVVKVNNSGGDPSFARQLDALHEQAARHPGIRVLDEVLPYCEVLSLYASADAIVSLHRAEGVGLPLLEGMALGRTAVATGWSGCTDFMDDTCACLVPYRLVPVSASTQAAYRPEHAGADALWAEPSVEEAALALQRLARQPELREQLGQRAARRIAERQKAIDVEGLLAALREAARARGVELRSGPR